MSHDQADRVDLGIIVVAYRSAPDVDGLLGTLAAAAGRLTTRVVVVDNDSGDEIEAVLAGRAGVEYVPAGANLGYAGAINLGRRLVGATRAIVVLNPDLRLRPGSLRALYRELSKTGAGASVPRIVDPAGNVTRSLRREPALGRALGEALLGDAWPSRPGWLAEIVRRAGPYQIAGATDWATGAALMIATEVDATVGAWDDGRFFLYCEETDYCRRIRDAGWAIRYVPAAVVEHRGGGSGVGPNLVALGAVSRLRYFRKYHGPAATLAFRCVVVLEHALRGYRPGNRAALLAVLRPLAWTR